MQRLHQLQWRSISESLGVLIDEWMRLFCLCEPGGCHALPNSHVQHAATAVETAVPTQASILCRPKPPAPCASIRAVGTMYELPATSQGLDGFVLAASRL